MKKQTLKILASSLIIGSSMAIVGCDGSAPSGSNQDNSSQGGSALKAIAKEDIKIGFICIGDRQSTYDLNFMNAMNNTLEKLGMSKNQVNFIQNVPEAGTDVYDKGVELAEDGCNIIFGDSFGFESNMVRLAKEYPSIRFAHATGTKAHTEKLENYSNAFASIYEGRYLSGIAAGMKLNEMGGDHVLGYVGAFPFAEVKSGYTAFYLGAKSVCEDVTMHVSFTSSWGDATAESTTATTLIDNYGAQIVSQHADTYGAPGVCDNKGVPNCSYNISTNDRFPESYLVSTRVEWGAYFEHLINCAINNTPVGYDFSGSLKDGGVVVGELGKCAAEGTQAAIDAAAQKIIDGTLHVFDCSTFTVGGNTVTSYTADVDDAGDYVPETEVVKDGYFHEQEYRSAPYFDMDIDGITIH